MKILIAGATGLIGTALRDALKEKGYEMLFVSRSEPRNENFVQWSMEEGFRDEDLPRLEGLDAAINLAGESISGLRWTEEKKRAIRDSRVDGTRRLIELFSKLKQPPKTFIAGSAVGFYGDRGDEVMTEASRAGDTFLADVCKEWE